MPTSKTFPVKVQNQTFQLVLSHSLDMNAGIGIVRNQQEKDILFNGSPSTLSSGHFTNVNVIRLILLLPILVFGAILYVLSDGERVNETVQPISPGFRCPQFMPLQAEATQAIYDRLEFIAQSDYRNQSARLLSDAVQIPSVSYDNMGSIDADPRWSIFADLAEYLSKVFPAVHDRLELTKVNTHGLLYQWHGSDASLKPVVLMSHQDVVPVDSLDEWTFPPFSGHIDAQYVHGRGSSDCKNMLIAVFEAIENLIEAGFMPRRTIILSFGFDEEVLGTEGAYHLAQKIEELYGKDGISMIVDEGAGFTDLYGQIYASPGVAEKGYLDATITVTMPGGHSSVPQDHTAIGVLSQILVEIERRPYEAKLTPHNPLYQSMICAEKSSPKFPSKLRKFLKAGHLRKLAKFLEKDLFQRYLMATSVAETVVRGGLKVNALPESASAMINHRISIDEESDIVKEKLTRIAKSVAKENNLLLQAFDGQEPQPSSVHLKVGKDTLSPAPITPLDTPEYALLAGTIRSVFPSVLVAPGMSSGNTDTKSCMCTKSA